MEKEIQRLNDILEKKLPNLSKIRTYDGSKSIPSLTNLFRSIVLKKKFDMVLLDKKK